MKLHLVSLLQCSTVLCSAAHCPVARADLVSVEEGRALLCFELGQEHFIAIVD